jgi:hypothetical protein
MQKSIAISTHAVIGALSISCAASAGVINYGDFVGDNVGFFDVTEQSTDPGPLYGFPSPMGDSLEFPGTGFQSSSSGGGSNLLEGRLTMEIVANPGELISSITVTESGAYSNVGDSTSSVSAIAFAETADGLFDGGFMSQWEDDVAGDWQASFTIAFDPTESVMFTLDNQLFTSAGADWSAYIDKQNITIAVNVVPAPGVLALLGLSGLAVRRRRT